jgi:hypothetical protein
MTPGKFPLTLYRGDTYRWSFLLWTDTDKTSPADLTGVVAKAEIRDKPAGSTVVPVICHVTLPNIIEMTLSAAACATLPSTGVWDLQLTYDNGDVATVLAGAVTVTPDVTDSAAGRMLMRVA